MTSKTHLRILLAIYAAIGLLVVIQLFPLELRIAQSICDTILDHTRL